MPEVQKPVLEHPATASKGTLVSLSFDPTEIQKQIGELMYLAKTKEIRRQLFGILCRLRFDLVFGELRSTLGTDGITECTQSFRIGCFENLCAALRAGELELYVGTHDRET